MNDLKERLETIAEHGTRGVVLTRPGHRRVPRVRARIAVAAAVGGAMVALAIGVASLGGSGGGSHVKVMPEALAPASPGKNAPVVAFVWSLPRKGPPPSDEGFSISLPRGWLPPGPPKGMAALGSLLPAYFNDTEVAGYYTDAQLIRVPVGTHTIELHVGTHSCSFSFTATKRSRLIVKGLMGTPEGANGACATVTPLEQTPLGDGSAATPALRPYLGLTLEQAQTYAKQHGQIVNVDAMNGFEIARTGFQRNRVDVAVFDNRVVHVSSG